MEAAHFFEGTEKLLEVWFSRQQSDASQGSGDLRTIPRWVRGTWGGAARFGARPQVGPGRRAGTGFSRCRRCGAAWGRGGRRGRVLQVTRPGRGARGPPAGVVRLGVPARARAGRARAGRAWAAGLRAGLPPRARRPRVALGRRDWAGAAVSQCWARRGPDVPCSKAPRNRPGLCPRVS